MVMVMVRGWRVDIRDWLMDITGGRRDPATFGVVCQYEKRGNKPHYVPNLLIIADLVYIAVVTSEVPKPRFSLAVAHVSLVITYEDR
jgi:hypothetical protein